jgi:hypothetical protein
VSGCCSGYGEIFGEKAARRGLRRYRRRGLDALAADAVAFARSRGLDGATVLEVGGGVGALQVELLKAGAERAVNVELSPGYEEAAAELARAEGLERRLERRLGDFVLDEALVEPADVVVLNRVVCCYPDFEALLGAAARHSRRLLVFTYPRGGFLARLASGSINLFLRLRGCGFRTYAHPPAALLRTAQETGLRVAHERHGLVWQLAALER